MIEITNARLLRRPLSGRPLTGGYANPACAQQLPQFPKPQAVHPTLNRGIGIKNEILKDIRDKIFGKLCLPHHHRIG